jgi:ABC-type multidrug transport system fused ATPase/permease subunit
MNIYKKLWSLLKTNQRRNAFVLVVLMLFGMILETLGVSLVIPALAIMSSANLVVDYPLLDKFINIIGNPSKEKLIITGIIMLVCIFTIKTIYLAFLSWRQAHFVYRFQAKLSQRLFEGYLRQPYSFHLLRNSAQLIRNAMGQVNDISNIVQQSLILVTELLVFIGISFLLILIEPLGAFFAISIFGFVGWGFHFCTRKHILRWGEARQHHEGLRIQVLQEGLGGVKDVKLLGREKNFFTSYWLPNSESARVGLRQATLQTLPRLWLELLAVLALAVLVVTMVTQGKPLELLLPTLGLFAAAAFRIMPMINRILAAIQNVRFSLPAIDNLCNEFKLLDAETVPHKVKQVTFQKILTLDQVNFKYPTAKSLALKEISLSIPFGNSVGFIGSSGSGKSTLVDIMLGLLSPDGGVVTVDGLDIQENLRGWQDQIGYVPQSIFLTDDSLRRNIAFGLPDELIDDKALSSAIHMAQLEEFIKDLPYGLETMVGERGVRLSGGQRQRIGIARALYHNPTVLLLDEATSSLDIKTEREFMRAVEALKGKKTLIIVAHRLSTVRYCDWLYRIEKGKILDEGKSVNVLKSITDGT